jgi:hypothetical protein
MSGYAAEIIDSAAIADGTLPLISKPVMPAQLLARVREILDGQSQPHAGVP